MKRSLLHITSALLLLATLAISTTGCNRAKRLNERVTLWRKDKIPYGTFYARENLQRLFPDAEIVDSRLPPDQSQKLKVGNTGDYSERRTSYVVISSSVMPNRDEMDAMFRMVSRGDQVFISSLNIKDDFLDTLQLKASLYTGFFNERDSLEVAVNDPVTATETKYTYPGKALDNYFSSMDSTITTVLGKDAEGRANFVKISYESGGAFYLHLAPLALTNFFLLHKENKGYYDEVLSYMPKNTEVIRWDDFFRNSESNRGNSGSGRDGKGFSALTWWWGQQGLNLALLLLILLLVIIYLVESKRKQRIIPLIPPVNNASLDFVKTIGRLYFQRKDNKDLAYKMMVHFQGYVRSRYNVRSSAMDDEFTQKLSYKSGYNKEAVHELVYALHYAQAQPQVTDHELLDLNHKLETFYRHA